MGILKHYNTIGKSRCKEAKALSDILGRVEKQKVVMSFATEGQFDQHLMDMARRNWSTCDGCTLASGRYGGAIYGTGTAEAELLVVSASPSTEDNHNMRSFSDRPGDLLKKMLAKAGFDLAQVFFTSIVACPTPDGRQPSKQERSTCSPRLASILDTVKPRSALLLGPVAGSLTETSRAIGPVDRRRWGSHLSSSFGLEIVCIATSPDIILTQTSNRKKKEMAKELYDQIKYIRSQNG